MALLAGVSEAPGSRASRGRGDVGVAAGDSELHSSVRWWCSLTDQCCCCRLPKARRGSAADSLAIGG